jgi:predicted lysophospholipase L1 biosynthesis ABC-type transport system permease subunit
VVVNEAFVHKFVEGKQPIGETFATGRRFVKPTYEIIGVVGDTKYRSLREVPPPIYYTDDYGPKEYPDAFILHVRSSGDPHVIIGPVRQLVRSIDAELPLFQVDTLAEEVDQSLWQERLLVVLTCCFGAFTLSLSAIGLYGILAYFVARRQQEIGLRMALGADSRDVIWLMAQRVLPTLALGVVSGAALSWVASSWVRSLLYGVLPFDPVTFVGAILLLIGIGIGGAVMPTVRAIRVDPSSTLRQD